jgi:hypothetical protein
MQCNECLGKSCGPKGIAACKQQLDDSERNQRREWEQEGREDEADEDEE